MFSGLNLDDKESANEGKSMVHFVIECRSDIGDECRYLCGRTFKS